MGFCHHKGPGLGATHHMSSAKVLEAGRRRPGCGRRAPPEASRVAWGRPSAPCPLVGAPLCASVSSSLPVRSELCALGSLMPRQLGSREQGLTEITRPHGTRPSGAHTSRRPLWGFTASVSLPDHPGTAVHPEPAEIFTWLLPSCWRHRKSPPHLLLPEPCGLAPPQRPVRQGSPLRGL